MVFACPCRPLLRKRQESLLATLRMADQSRGISQIAALEEEAGPPEELAQGRPTLVDLLLDAHAVEGAVDEDQRHDKQPHGDGGLEAGLAFEKLVELDDKDRIGAKALLDLVERRQRSVS